MSNLTRTEAAERSALLDVHGYLVDLDLTTGDEVFRSRTTISFAAANGAETFLDLHSETLHSVLLNGAPADFAVLDGGRLRLRGLATENELVVEADLRYSHECEGLHRYTDPADGKVYVYAFVYINNAPRVFACFDQPDLKAGFTFTVKTPEDWQVLGNSEPAELSAGRWQVGPTPPQATYLTTLLAGPYESRYTDHGGIRLGFHCRASLAQYFDVDVAEMFEVTGQCLDAYAQMFGVPYPFGKLDHVFVPEFSLLSLDHPGCVLLRELYLYRTPGTASERETRAVVLAHGISLMWLAGLVTNAWWDDLWLAQAFADYMAHRVTSEATRFPGPPTTFAARRKAQAYVPDQRVSTTHPIKLDGPDVQTVLLELDRISYFKGHSVIRQLAATVGTEALRDGLRSYFARHAYGTATAQDFFAALGEATGSDLSDWAHRWFGEPNVNTLCPEIAVQDGVISAAAVLQTAPDSHPVLRRHTIDIGLYGAQDSTVRVEVEGERTELPQLVGRPAPEFLLLNDGDLTYAKIRLDPRSLAALPTTLPRLSPLNRAMLWCQLLLAVQDGVLPAEQHLQLVIQLVAGETELSILTEVLEQARYDVADRFLAPEFRERWLARVAGALRERLAGTAPDDERLTALFRNLIDFSADVSELRGLLEGIGVPAGIVLDADTGWRVRYRLAVLGAVDEAEIAAANADDPSAQGDQFAAKARAARPDPAAKQAAWEAIMRDTNLSSYQIWSLAEGFWQPEQLELTAPYARRFFEEMPAAARLRGDLVLDVLVRFLYPRFAAEPAVVQAADRLIRRSDIALPLRRRVEDFTDDLRRVISARAGIAAELAPVG